MGLPQVACLANDRRLLEMVRSVSGKEAIPFRATLFDKSPAANWLVVWHQDTALPLRNRFDAPGWGPWSEKAGVIYAHAPEGALSRVVALRVHLDASTERNGPLRVVPESYTGGVLTDDEIGAMVRERGFVECLVAKGGVIAMRPLLIHSSSKVTTNTARRVLHIEYADSLSLGDGIELAVA
jgi:ectoine hydroxylase-related dioxygenase (phytanoyl-CoA dioxygenase family)